MVASRCPCRPSRRAAAMSRSISRGVRYSRLRRAAFGAFRGGIREGMGLLLRVHFPQNSAWAMPLGLRQADRRRVMCRLEIPEKGCFRASLIIAEICGKKLARDVKGES